MAQEIKAVGAEERPVQRCSVRQFGLETAKRALAFHRSFPEYEETPLVRLEQLAEKLGVERIFIKDESYRFGLNAFKVLGGSYCIGRDIGNRLGIRQEDLSYKKICAENVKAQLGQLTYVTATDGNHGRGIAWTANRLGHKSVVYMPKGSAAERLEHIRKLGADASITELNYDDAVRHAKDMAERHGWIMVQDTAWEGYETVPGWIMEGYTTMAYEIWKQMGEETPTHIFLQAGVGAMAGAVTGFFADLFPGEKKPKIIIVEPDRADCLYRTAKANDGKIHEVKGHMNTIMAGLACGEPCTIAWEIIRDYADYFVSMPDYVAANGMRILGNPMPGDPKVISGESGAAGLGLAAAVLEKQELAWLKDALSLDSSSRILCISTEGDTDRANYRRIVWEGRYPDPAWDHSSNSTTT